MAAKVRMARRELFWILSQAPCLSDACEIDKHGQRVTVGYLCSPSVDVGCSRWVTLVSVPAYFKSYDVLGLFIHEGAMMCAHVVSFLQYKGA